MAGVGQHFRSRVSGAVRDVCFSVDWKWQPGGVPLRLHHCVNHGQYDMNIINYWYDRVVMTPPRGSPKEFWSPKNQILHLLPDFYEIWNTIFAHVYQK